MFSCLCHLHFLYLKVETKKITGYLSLKLNSQKPEPSENVQKQLSLTTKWKSCVTESLGDSLIGGIYDIRTLIVILKPKIGFTCGVHPACEPPHTPVTSGQVL